MHSPQRPLPVRVAGAVLCLLATLALVGGCGSNRVEVGRFPVTAVGHESCQRLLRALPRHVSDQPRRPVTGSTYAAAWGDPPIVLRCGVGRPRGYDRFSACQTANGIDWFVPSSAFNDEHADVLMTTLYRRPAVSVHLPATYRPPVAAMVDLAGTIKQHTTATGHCQ